MYHTTQPFDPEGVLGTINSIVMGFIGMQVSYIHRFVTETTRNIVCILNYILYICTDSSQFVVYSALWQLLQKGR